MKKINEILCYLIESNKQIAWKKKTFSKEEMFMIKYLSWKYFKNKEYYKDISTYISAKNEIHTNGNDACMLRRELSKYIKKKYGYKESIYFLRNIIKIRQAITIKRVLSVTGILLLIPSISSASSESPIDSLGSFFLGILIFLGVVLAYFVALIPFGFTCICCLNGYGCGPDS